MPPQPVLPDGCTELIVHRARPFWRHHATAGAERQAAHLFVGQMLVPVVLTPDEDADVVGIRFEPHGAHPFLAVPQSELADPIVDGSTVAPPWLARAMREAQARESADDALTVLEDALRFRAFDRQFNTAHAATVQRAIDHLTVSCGRVPIDELVTVVGGSARRLERLFLEHVGTTPKRFARVLRVQSLAGRLAKEPHASMADLAIDRGFYDQAHMIKEFVTFSGATPGEFRKTLGDLTRVMLA
jgi:methylphosphotriester-DNA--protein-cysteine methyltransferase